MIAVLSQGDMVDFIVMSSIWYGICRAGGPVVRFKKGVNLKGVKRLCLSGHGEPGQVQGYTADEIAEVLTDPLTGCKDTIEELLITCCSSGCRVNDVPGSSVVETICAALRVKYMVIEGAMGPSIKANALGEQFRVVNQALDPGLNKAFKAQGDAIQKDSTLASKNIGATSSGEAQKTFSLTNLDEINLKASECAESSTGFFKTFDTAGEFAWWVENRGFSLLRVPQPAQALAYRPPRGIRQQYHVC